MVIFSFSHTRGVKIDNLAEKKRVVSTVHTVSLSVKRVQIISCDANPFAPGSSHGDSSYYGYCMLSVSVSSVCNSPGESVCLYCIYAQYVCVFDGKPQGLCRQVGSDGLIPTLADTVDIKTSKADLRSGSATSGQSLELQTERRSDVSIWGRGSVTEGVGVADMMSLGGGALVLLVYGGFILQQSQAQVTAPAPCKTQT